jgi:nitroreductase/NAD-dependent dihydropyrimidine dehydrogenase PreA subunit
MDIFNVDENKCTQCGACAAVCAWGLIDFKKNSYPRPFPLAEQSCRRCAACMIVCPTESIIHRDISYDECPSIDKRIKVSYDVCAQLIKARRSIRTFKDKPVPRELITRAIDAARYSPTTDNMQNVQWLVIDEKDKVRHLREVGGKWLVGAIKDFPTYAPLVDIWEKRREAGIDILLFGAQTIISVYAVAGKDWDIANYIVCSSALAYFNLAAISLGLGCCWSGFFAAATMFSPPIKEAIALPEGCQIYGSLLVGYPKYKYNRIPRRNPARIAWR